MRALGMLSCRGAATTRGGTEDNGERGLSPEHVVDLRHLIDNLVHRSKGKRHHPRADDRPEATAGSADTGAHIGFFRDRADAHSLLAKFRDKARQCAQAAAQVKHSRIAPHLLTKGFQHSFGISNLTHAASSRPQGANTSCKASSGLGNGLALANATAASIASRTSRSIWASVAAVAIPCSCSLAPNKMMGSCCWAVS